jgi:hypothetical protein
LLVRTKDLFPFHVRDSNCERWTQCILQNCICKLFWVTRLGCPPQEKFTRPITWLATFLEMTIQCYLLESSNIIIKSYNIQASSHFPWLLKLHVMHYFREVASGHVHKLLKKVRIFFFHDFTSTNEIFKVSFL